MLTRSTKSTQGPLFHATCFDSPADFIVIVAGGGRRSIRERAEDDDVLADGGGIARGGRWSSSMARLDSQSSKKKGRLFDGGCLSEKMVAVMRFRWSIAELEASPYARARALKWSVASAAAFDRKWPQSSLAAIMWWR